MSAPSVDQPTTEECFIWLGDHDGKKLRPALPLAYCNSVDGVGRYALLMSDRSMHLVNAEQLKKIIAGDLNVLPDGPLRSKEPQTILEAAKKIGSESPENEGSSPYKEYKR